MATANTVFERIDSIEKEKLDTLMNSEPLPTVTASDNGKVLTVVNGEWTPAEGGGSSDFSTAEVTLIDSNGLGVQLSAPVLNLNGTIDFPEIDGYISPDIYTDEGSCTVVLYKGCAIIKPMGDGYFSVSGNATMENLDILVTGDCTITIAEAPPEA